MTLITSRGDIKVDFVRPLYHKDHSKRSKKHKAVKVIIDLGRAQPVVCESHLHTGDAYSYIKGRKVALTKALERAGLTKHERAEVWQQLFEKGFRYDEKR